MSLPSFENPFTAAVFGASGGVGRALTKALAASTGAAQVCAFSRTPIKSSDAAVKPGAADLASEASIAAALQTAADEAAAARAPLRLVLVATGLLHGPGGVRPEKSFNAIDGAAMAEVFAVNTIGPALIAKHALPRLPKTGKSVFAALSARVGSISDNGLGGWHSYRASKAALNMLIKNFAIELQFKRKDAVCIGLHPGTVDTGLSKPFQKNVADGKLFTPDYSAARLLAVIDTVSAQDSGKCFAWDGAEIAP